MVSLNIFSSSRLFFRLSVGRNKGYIQIYENPALVVVAIILGLGVLEFSLLSYFYQAKMNTK